MNIITITLLLVTHYIADFLLQTRQIADNKHKLSIDMFYHVVIYFVCFLPFGIFFAGINAGTHMLIDSVTSQFTRKYGEQKRWKAFFNVIGLDQLLHTLMILGTYILLTQ